MSKVMGSVLLKVVLAAGGMAFAAWVSMVAENAFAEDTEARVGNAVPTVCTDAATAFTTRIDHGQAEFAALRACFDSLLPKLIPTGPNCTGKLADALREGKVRLVEPSIVTPMTDVGYPLAAQVLGARKYRPKPGDDERLGYEHVMDQRARGTVWLYDVATAHPRHSLTIAWGACGGADLDEPLETSCYRGLLINEIGVAGQVHISELIDNDLSRNSVNFTPALFASILLFDVIGNNVIARVVLPTSEMERNQFRDGMIRIVIDPYKGLRRIPVDFSVMQSACEFRLK